MAKKETIIVEEIDGEDVSFATTVVSTRVEEPPKPKVAVRNRMAGWPQIILEENDDIPPVGQFFGLNGESYILRTGVMASVPQGIVDILDNAIVTVPHRDPNTLQVIGWKDKLRYPYRLIKAAA
jgi:hypothetical protein